MSLGDAIRDAERAVEALKRELARDQRAIAREHARAARAEDNIEQWWFGRARWRRVAVAVRLLLFR